MKGIVQFKTTTNYDILQILILKFHIWKCASEIPVQGFLKLFVNLFVRPFQASQEEGRCLELNKDLK